MGSRHNRKRTRSRPRNRLGSRTNTLNFDNLPTLSSPAVPSFPSHQRPAQHWQQQYDVWQTRQHLQRQQSFVQPGLCKRDSAFSTSSSHSTSSSISSVDTLDARRIRMFGGSEEDEESLCAPMLQVVLDLFDGQIDYNDHDAR